MDSKSIEFRTGFLRGSERVKTAEMREPTVDDQLLAQEATKSQAQAELRLFAALCGITPDEIRTLSIYDYGQLQDAYAGFLA